MRARLFFPLLLSVAGCPNRDGTDPDPDPIPTTDTSPKGQCVDSPGATVCDGNAVVTCSPDGEVASSVPCDGGSTCEGGTCVPCEPNTLAVPFADPAVVEARGIRLDLDPVADPTGRVAFLRPVEILADAEVRVTGPVELFDADGAPLANGAEVSAGDRILVRGVGLGAATLDVDDGICAGALVMEVDLPRSLAGRPLDAFPWFESPDLFVAEDDDVSLLIDPGDYFDRVGVDFDAYVVAPRTPAEWAEDPTLTPLVGPIAGQAPISAATPLTLWADPDPGGLVERYSVVLDFDRDGQLSPGDLVDGFDEPGFSVLGDLSGPGPYPVQSADITLDPDNPFMLYWPVSLDVLEPLPLVVISHGNGHDYHWYDYLGNHFASHGYAVISHQNDTGDTSIIPAANSTWQSTDVFLSNLAQIAGGTLDGEVDSHRIAFIGHSRGGEGVVIAYNGLVGGQIVPQSFAKDDVVLVSSIAPTVWTSPELADPNDVVYHQMDGSSDGDVTGGVDNSITQYLRIFQGATNTHALTYVQGATHNDFNCCGFDDGAGVTGPKIGRAAAQQIAKSYYLALLRAVFDGDAVMWELFSRNPERFRPAGVETPVTTLLLSADAADKVVLDDFEANPDLTLASSGGVVSYTVTNPVEGALNDGDTVLQASMGDPFNGMTWVESGDSRPDRGLVFDWVDGSDATYEIAIPKGLEDWRSYALLSFRVAQSTRHPYTVALNDLLSFTVELQDADGAVSAIDFGVYGAVNEPYQRTGLGNGAGWVNEFQTVQIPVEAFSADGAVLDRSRIAVLRLRFGAVHGSAQGRVGLDDIELLKEVTP